MKRVILFTLTILLSYSISGQKKVNVKLNPALTNIAGDKNNSSSYDQVPFAALQFGVGMIWQLQQNFIPFPGFLYYNPMIQYTPGGQGYKSGNYLYGDCWNFLTLPNTVGYSYPIKNNQNVNFEFGPSINFLLGASNIYTTSEGDREKVKVASRSLTLRRPIKNKFSEAFTPLNMIA